jgi:hypothetical protein
LEIESDISGFPKTKQGSITTLCLIMKRMVVKNQEARDALETCIKDFDITKFPGENVPIACLCLKAVATALGNEDLPQNIIRKVLEGFAKLSTKSFNNVCSSQVAMRRISFYKDVLKRSSLHTQLIEVLDNLENTYLELVGGKKWEGVGHPGLTKHNSVFKGERSPKMLRTGMPWDEWVKKYAKCNHCGEIGHTQPKCEKYLAQIESGKIKRPKKGPSRDLLRKGGARQKKNYLQDPKARAFFSAFHALFSEETDNDVDDGKGDADDQAFEMQEEITDKDITSFLLMVGGSLKD